MPTCIERKITLTGAVQEYSCELVYLQAGFGILRYVIDREYDIRGIRLLPGDVTCALYWEDRPYTLYVWHLRRSGETLYYFNIADSVSLGPEEFRWRDLTIDILIDGKGDASILDDHELPAGLDADLGRSIGAAVDHILAGYRDIIREADGLIARSC